MCACASEVYNYEAQEVIKFQLRMHKKIIVSVAVATFRGKKIS